MSEEPLCPQKGPYQVMLEAGKAYFWCTCGRSARQPFCDGSHKTTTLQPHKLKVPELSATKRCGCKVVVLCEPSQKGCLAERPQVHQK